MSTIQRFVGQLEQLSDDEVAGIAISSGVKLDGDEWVPANVSLTTYERNPVALRDHDPSRVIGTASAIGLTPDKNAIAIRIRFAPLGISAVADEARGLAKAGILKGISAGINPLEWEPLGSGEWGRRITKSELLEVSLVAIPADSDALITARSFSARRSTLAILRSLPIVSEAAQEAVINRLYAPPARPVGLMSAPERAAFYAEQQRLRTMTVWASGQASAAEQRESLRQRYEALTNK
ncbi:MAG: HK97 family phage prohead protease [Steroidobacteraceae bacterium]